MHVTPPGALGGSNDTTTAPRKRDLSRHGAGKRHAVPTAPDPLCADSTSSGKNARHGQQQARGKPSVSTLKPAKPDLATSAPKAAVGSVQILEELGCLE
ncbi:unnamed protein product [Lampetra planeri]